MFGARVVLQLAVPKFIARYPEMHLDLVTERCQVDIVAEGFDAGIRLAEGEPKDMVAVAPGGTDRFVAVAAPSYLKKRGIPASEAIASGKLSLVLDDWCPRFPGLCLYYPGHRQAPAGLRAFVDVLKEVSARRQGRNNRQTAALHDHHRGILLPSPDRPRREPPRPRLPTGAPHGSRRGSGVGRLRHAIAGTVQGCR
jgi:DNA-binding transcriptional LysR family regulator